MAQYDQAFLDDLANRLGDYLEMTGRSTKKNFPCISPDHADKNPSMHYYGKTCFCFSCGARYNLFKVIGVDFNISDFRGQVKKACELFRVTPKTATKMTEEIRDRETARAQRNQEPPKSHPIRNYERLFAYCRSRIQETDYPKRRGFSDELVKKAGLGFHPKFHIDKEGHTWPILMIPVDKNHFVVRNTDPEADKNSRFHASSGGRVLYTRFSDVLNSKNPTWIVEGEIDALSIADAGGEAIGLGSTQNVSKLLRYLKENPPQSSLILALDSDERGREAQEKLTDGLRDMGIPYITARRTEYKDANAFLQDDKKQFCQYIRRESLSAVLANGFSR